MKKVLTGNHQLVRNLNSQVVLDLIRTGAPISGAKLAKLTGMQPSTIMNILRSLEKRGLIMKRGIGLSSPQGGRKPTLWEICGSYGYVIGIKIELTEIQGVLVDLNSKTLERVTMECYKKQTLTSLTECVQQVVERLISPHRLSRKHVLGLGIGVSGMVDYKNGVIVKTDLVDETPVPLKAALQKHFDFPVFVENDANAAVLYERWYGKGRGVSNLVYMLVVIAEQVFGIGYGLVLEDHIYRGAHMFAGETKPHRPSIAELVRRAVNHGQNQINLDGRLLDIEKVTVHDLIGAGQKNDPIAIKYFDELGKILAEEVANLINLLDPEKILIGGEITQAGELLLESICSHLTPDTLMAAAHDVESRIDISFSEDAVALGATTLILQNIFRRPVIQPRDHLV
ncbi:MAG: ROK family transcriptional regulator [candidate division KSB1 bacterium]|nr:ROK family transcriptional regulator [candidate division KSB1 bacterium]MDZ7304732.1 ROK family transcriptional regulator [candidate division KSB1 bacterium]MDZ7313836.1 ROK family transcriptional regulator [candidate division KSB1 bacterium]